MDSQVILSAPISDMVPIHGLTAGGIGDTCHLDIDNLQNSQAICPRLLRASGIYKTAPSSPLPHTISANV